MAPVSIRTCFPDYSFRGAMMLGLLCVGVLEGATAAGKVSDGVYFSALNNFTIPVP